MRKSSATVAASVRHHALVTLGLAISLCALYLQTLGFDYVYFDDNDYVLENPVVLQGLTWDGIHWAMTSLEVSNWHPLTWLSHMLDVSLFGPDPGWAHLHNMLLHGINSVLVYFLLLRWGTTLLPAALLALIFLVHPLHVESVAWIAERKDLLCALFFLLSLLAYDTFRSVKQCRWYLLTLLLAVLALMAKAMAVSLPVVMVLLDLTIYHSASERALPGLRAVINAVVGKLPLIILVAGVCALTIVAQDGGQAVAYLDAHSVTDRLETAGSAYVIYLRQWLLPTNLVAFYPLVLQGTTFAWVAPWVMLLGLSAITVLLWRRWPAVTLGWAWYVVTLLPVIGLVQVGAQAHADRYMYLPSIGLLLIALTLFPSPQQSTHRSAIALTTTFSVFLALLSYMQIGTWQNQYTVFSRVLQLEGDNYKARIHLAGFSLRHNELEQAEKHANASIALAPALGDGYQALGNIALARGQFAAAETYFHQAIAAGPELGPVFNNLGIALAQQGKQAAAARAFARAVELSPYMTVARDNLARQHQKLEATQ